MQRKDEGAPDSGEVRWTGDAAAYDSWFDEPWGRYASAIERQAITTAAGDTSGALVLEVGCGSGRVSPTGATIIGVDRDVSMLTLARRRIGDRVVCADACDLPFRDGVADLSLAVTLCEFVEDPRHVIDELARVTRHGGHMVIGALNRASPWGLAHRREFNSPPWDRARFLTDRDLIEASAPHGPTTTRSVLFAPDAWPGLGWWGPLVEHVGRIMARRHGAFVVSRTIVD